MPHAKIDVELLRTRLAAVPAKDRPAAIALYVQLVLMSAEMLLDGSLPTTLVLAGAHEIGISRGRYGRSEVQKIVTSLSATGLVEEHNDGTVELREWRHHHNSREYVQSRRTSDAERKRDKRGQLTLHDETDKVRSGRPADVRSGHDADLARAHARRRAAAETEDLAVAATRNETTRTHEPDPTAAAADLEHLLDQLDITASLRDRATAEPDRALAVARYTISHNAGGGYFRRVFESGDWPQANGAAAVDPADRRRTYVEKNGFALPDEELDYQLREKGADEAEIQGLIELAYTLRETTTR